MSIKKVVLTLLITASLLSSCSNNTSEPELIGGAGSEETPAVKIDILGWYEKTPPKINSDEWYEANHSKDEWKVEYSGGIKVSKHKYTDSIRYETSNGIFYGINHGEWGGNLFFYPAGDEAKKYEVMDGNIVGMYQINKEIYVLEGLAHLLMSQGSVYRLKEDSGKWVAEKVIDLTDAPYAFTIVDEKTVYIVTSGKIVKVEEEKVKETIVTNAFWQGLYPNSIIHSNNKLFIGMREGVAAVDLKSKKVSWFVEKK